jgi:Flp pilus assembly protein TadG
MSLSGSNKGKRGTAALEFALTGAIFLSVMFGVIDLSRYVASRTALRAAVGEVARAAITDTTINSTTARTLALAHGPVLTPTLFNISLSRATDSVTVSADYTFTFLMPGFGSTPRVLSASITSPL